MLKSDIYSTYNVVCLIDCAVSGSDMAYALWLKKVEHEMKLNCA